MQNNAKSPPKMKVFPKGQVIIPVSLRRKYNINIGDQLEFISFENGILLKPSKHESSTKSLTDELFGMFRNYTEKIPSPDKDATNKALENGLSEGWKE